MKRETKKRVRKPVQKSSEEKIEFIFNSPIVQEKGKEINVTFPDVWNEEVARAAKVLGETPLEVITRLMVLLPQHYPNHLRMLEAIVEYERGRIKEKTAPHRDREEFEYRRGREVADEETRRLNGIMAEVSHRREIIEPTICTCKPPF